MSHAAASRRGQGFTLVELVLVLGVAAVLAAIAVPRYVSATSRYRVQLAADRIARDIAHVQQRALLRGASQTITFVPASRSYTITGMVDPDFPAKTYTVSLSADPYRAATLAADFGGGAVLTFNGHGVPAAGGTVAVKAQGYACTVSVAGVSGVATVTAPTAE